MSRRLLPRALTAVTAATASILLSLVPTARSLAASAPRMPPLADRRASAEYSCSTCAGPAFHRGLSTYRVPMALFELNRARLVEHLLERLGPDASGVVLLEGGKQRTRYDTDHEPVFRQESYFHWAFGADVADLYGTVSLPDGEATLFVPERSEQYQVFCGKSEAAEGVRATYGVDRVLTDAALPDYVARQLEGDGSSLYLLRGPNTDSGNMAMPAHYPGIDAHAGSTCTDSLFPSMQGLRVTKTAAEMDLMRYTHWVSSAAHVEVMRSSKPGMMEYQLESLFQHHTYTHGGARHMSYTCVCACGPSAAILHYGHAGAPNDRMLRDGDTALLDMGAEYHCYASDITCSFPINGTFTDDQRLIYGAVLAAQIEVISRVRPGVSWQDMHRAAERVILTHLRDGGLLVGDVGDMLAAGLGAIFMPHGLGHLIGLDAHDVGGYAEGTPPRSGEAGLRSLRTARDLGEDMVLTVEPGCYFIDLLLDAALENPVQKKFMVGDQIERFRGTGGVRLEDGIVVTADGCENLTMCPRSIEEVEAVVAGGAWPPAMDEVPKLRRNWVVRTDKGRMERVDVPLALVRGREEILSASKAS